MENISESQTTNNTGANQLSTSNNNEVQVPTNPTREALELKRTLESNPDSIESFGLSAQNRLSSLSDGNLQTVSNRNAGTIGKQLSDLNVKLKMDNDVPNKHKGLLKYIFGKAKQTSYQLRANYQSTAASVAQISDVLKKSALSLENNNKLLKKMFDETYKTQDELQNYIDAGALRLNDYDTKLIPAALEKSKNATNNIERQHADAEYQQLSGMRNRLSKRVYNLRLAQQVVQQQGPQLNIIASANKELIDKINNATETMIPLWKNQISIRLALADQENALRTSKEIDDATNRMLMENADLLKTTSISIVKQSNTGGIKEDTLEHAQQALIDTVKECQREYANGEKMRQEASQRLQKLNDDYHKQLTDIINRKDTIPGTLPFSFETIEE